MNSSTERPAAGTRLASLDALRGFDMFWLLGGQQIVHALCAGAAAGTVAFALNQQFEHVEWEGFRFYDFIFPLFQFLIGVAIPLAVERRLARGDSKGKILKHAMIRFCWMVFIGLFITGNLLSWKISEMRLSYSVLEMLGLGYVIAVTLVLFASLRGQIIATGVFLVGYWGLQMFIPVPGHEWGVFKEGGILGDWLFDHSIGLLGKPWESPYGRGFPWLPMWTHAATTMMGVFGCNLLRAGWDHGRKLKWLVLLGGGCLASALLWSWHLPIVKNRWTSSFALWCGGLSYWLLALFYWAIDVKGWHRGTGLWTAIGSNSILAYILAALFMGAFGSVTNTLFGGLQPLLGDYTYGIFAAIFTYTQAWLLLACLRRQKIFFRL